MAKSAPPPAPSTLWTIFKLLTTLAVLAAIGYAIKLALDAVNDAVAQGKQALDKKGVSISKSGMAVKTDRRALTQEETEDKLQRSLMKGWKNSTFQVPWLLQKTTNLGGSTHDKQKEEWEQTHGPKKRRVE
ncbi:hypothetical protein JCM8547_000381 [Rhodosporidiobolus lusitaniae]